MSAGTCNRCGGLTPSVGYTLCPACRRNDQLLDQQRRVAAQDAAEHRQAQEEAHLNEIKLKLLDLAIAAIEDKESAARKASVLMRSSDFSQNLHFFWRDVSGNEFLFDVYFSDVLKPLVSQNWPVQCESEIAAYAHGFAANQDKSLFITQNGQTFGPHDPEEIADFIDTGKFRPDNLCWREGWAEWRPISSFLSENSVIKLLDGLDYRVRDAVGPWLEKQTSDSSWGKKALPLYRFYEQVVERRKIEQQKENEEIARRSAEEQAEFQRQEAQKAAENAAKQASAARSSFLPAVGATLSFMCGFMIAGAARIALWVRSGEYLSFCVFVILMAACIWPVFRFARVYLLERYLGAIDLPVGESSWRIRHADIYLTIAGGIFLLIQAWPLFGSANIVAQVFAVVLACALPCVPLLRGLLGAIMLGSVVGLVAIPVCWLAGWFAKLAQ
jgi:hypothetical protein